MHNFGSIFSEWNTTVVHWSLTDQLVVMTDYNFASIGRTYMIDLGVIVLHVNGRKSMSDLNV